MDEKNMNQNQEVPHKRRERYSGKYPKKFQEKYKELQPEKYGDTVAKVISKGGTPDSDSYSFHPLYFTPVCFTLWFLFPLRS